MTICDNLSRFYAIMPYFVDKGRISEINAVFVVLSSQIFIFEEVIMIKQTLQDLGVTCNYNGYYQAIFAIQLALENEDRLCSVTQQIYWVVADKTHCKRCNVERNIRTVIFRAWKINKDLLIEMAGFPLTSPPSVSEFLAIMVTYLKRMEE